MPSQSTMPVLQFVRICECGCGQPTLLRAWQGKRGEDHGQPCRFLRGHHNRVNPPGRPDRMEDGYIVTYRPDHPAANCHGYILKHRLVMEETLGRYLLASEVVHHKNKQTTDNRPENLQEMTRPEHQRLHRAEQRALRDAAKAA